MQPQTFGRYLLLEKMAEGGMGQVYRAVLRGGPGFEKEVAFKRMLRSVSNDPDFIARFTDEARIASTLNHSNIVQVFDFGEIEGEYFLTMEYVPGIDLGRFLSLGRNRGVPLTPPAAIHIAASFCRGLGAAHRRVDKDGTPRPIVHRDVSPQNILVSRSGEIKVTDFGIAKTAENVLRTRTGMVIGKCHYLSPEQAKGDSVDARADVFSAGAVLFEMLAGRALFAGDNTDQVLAAVLAGPIPTLRALGADVETDVAEIVERALRRDPRQRYPDGAAMARDLERTLRSISPEFSRDDIADLFDKVVPASPASKSKSPPTAYAVTAPAPGGQATEREAVDSRPHGSDTTLVDHSAQTEILSKDTASDVGSTHVDGAPQEIETSMPTPSSASARSRGLMLALTVIGGLCGGTVGLLIWSGPKRDDVPARLTVGQTVRRGDLRLTLQASRKQRGTPVGRPSQLILRLGLELRGHPIQQPGPMLALRRWDSPPAQPIFTHRRTPRVWLAVFLWPEGSGPLVLSLRLSEARTEKFQIAVE